MESRYINGYPLQDHRWLKYLDFYKAVIIIYKFSKKMCILPYNCSIWNRVLVQWEEKLIWIMISVRTLQNAIEHYTCIGLPSKWQESIHARYPLYKTKCHRLRKWRFMVSSISCCNVQTANVVSRFDLINLHCKETQLVILLVLLIFSCKALSFYMLIFLVW